MEERTNVPLHIERYRFEFTAQEKIHCWPYMGSAWRGVLGHGLKKTVCITGKQQCNGCPLMRHCLYAWCFVDDGNKPRPYVLSLDFKQSESSIPKGGRFSLMMNLFGKSNRALPSFTQALQFAGEMGVGKHGGRFKLHSVQQWTDAEQWEAIDVTHYDSQPVSTLTSCETSRHKRVTLQLETPVRLKRNGKLIGPDALSFNEFLWFLKRRIDSMTCHWQSDATTTALSKTAVRPLNIEPYLEKLTWRDWTRHSSHQGRMQMGGVVGKWCFDIDSVRSIWPMLIAGQWLHVGQAATMGLGRYRLIEHD